MSMKHVRRINPSEYNEVLNDGKEDFLLDELNLARKLDAFNTGTDILTFAISGSESVEIDTDAHTVDVVMPFENGLTTLEATFTLSEGATADEDSPFTEDYDDGAVTLTVTAADGTEQAWTITATEAAE